ncbi:receptor protein kinase TMK1-like [Ananas comosus]|uniref:Receptor protein kinase TMK1-like n=2 Tax=Ananas comosus TaxID=4615 RepID=A0A6P5F7H6_ANACO|nr:receptor protein kinase TMK1-like [Ananas comosus]
MNARINVLLVVVVVLVLLPGGVLCETDPGDYAVLDEFRKLLDNPEKLGWPSEGSDPCGPPLWPHVYCSGSRVSQIQVQNNRFRGPLPSLRGLPVLQFAFLNDNLFDAVPPDFLGALPALQVLSLDYNPLNLTTGGWSLPPDLTDSSALVNLTLSRAGLVGPIPDFLGALPSLAVLQLSYNNLSGPLPASFAGLSSLHTLWLNNQQGAAALSGPLDVLPSMTMLADVWLHGNAFSGPIPPSVGALSALTRLWLNSNRLVGLIPTNLTSLPALQSLQLDNNMLVGPIPAVRYNFTYTGNSFCSSTPGAPCSPQVAALLDFLGGVNYPYRLAQSWSGDNPCSGNWIGVSCSGGGKVSVINLPNFGLNGTISPSLGELDGLVDIKLGGNNLTGTIPANLTSLKSLATLDVSSNNLKPPVPAFSSSVKLLVDGNPALTGSSPPTSGSPPSPGSPGNENNSPNSPSNSPPSEGGGGFTKSSKHFNALVVVIPIFVGVILIISAVVFLLYRRQKGKKNGTAPSPIVIHPRDPSDPDNMVKIVIANNTNNNGSLSSDLRSGESSVSSNTRIIEAGNFIISLQVLRNATKNFAQENVLGRGGFGVVYKGMLHDGTMIAVKRMEASVLSNKAIDEFQAEIAVLTKVRHRNLVSILGYSIEDAERLLVYEYMPQGALSKHLFRWKQLGLEPLSWKKRLNIALDVARGMEYLHNLAHQCFIHRDLKSSNILLGDDYRAKVSDFGLVKLAPDGNSVVTRLAGTFGYLAPEYAVTGKITTKADVFSYGVVLMELITGLMALDESRAEETRYLASWFYNIKNSKEKLRAAIDLSLDVTDETFESIRIIAELAGHCTAREPHQRPDMGHAVNVLAPLVEKWKPIKDEQEEYLGIDFRQPLLQMVKGWQAGDSTTSDVSTVGLSLDDSKGSIPARPAGFAESFTSADGR